MASNIYQHFDFVVEGMTPSQAESLLDTILAFVEAHGLSMGGGVHQTTDADYPDEVDDEQEVAE